MRLEELIKKLNISGDVISQAVSKLLQTNRLVRAVDNRSLIDRSLLQGIREQCRDIIGSFHRRNPLKPFMPLSALRSAFKKSTHLVLETAIQELSTAELVCLETEGIRLSDHSVTYDPEFEKTRTKALSLYRAAGLRPPNTAEAARLLKEENFTGSEAVIRALIETGELVPLTHELLIHSAALETAKHALMNQLQQPEGITVSAARATLDTTRKYAVPLLELFDRQGFTVRRGDARVLSPSWKQ